MMYRLTKRFMAIYLWWQESGAVISPNQLARALPFSADKIARALMHFSRKNKGKLKFKVRLVSGEMMDEIWDYPFFIPSTVDGASDIIPVFVKN